MDSSRSLVLAFLFAALPAAALAADAPFAIHVVDEATGRGVPLVELETTNAVRYVTDSAGYVALDEPALFGRKVFFHLRSHGYEFPKDAFGYAGEALEVTPGGEAELKIKRLNIAERLYRVTGADIYRDSLRLGIPAPIKQPLLNAQVVGQDSVLTAIYRGKVHWFWGDTSKPAYPLGDFDAPGAISSLPAAGGLQPSIGVDLDYFEGPDGFAEGSADMPGEGPTWLDGLSVVKDSSGRERLFAAYVKIKPPLETYARGLVEWNDDANRFDKHSDLPLEAPLLPGGHPFIHAVDGVDYVYFARAFPFVRTQATVDDYTHLDRYEAFTCLAEGSTLKAPQLDRDPAGKLRYSWKRNTPAVGPAEQKKLVDAGLMKVEEGRAGFRDRDSGKPVIAHGGSVYWNEHRQRWVMILLETMGGPSFLGEIWYAEADAPEGPWAYATKVVTHDKYDFYNPKQHPFFDENSGRTLYFEGTYSNTFSGNPIKTPRYDYNQIMYRLDLADPRVAMPVAIYDGGPGGSRRFGDKLALGEQPAEAVAFYALDRGVPGTLPIFERDGRLITDAGVDEQARVAFYAFPPERETGSATRPLYEHVSPAGAVTYSTDSHRATRPVCRVWLNPIR